jgi:hypothetical protein
MHTILQKLDYDAKNEPPYLTTTWDGKSTTSNY